jgi:hypothetical protein
VISAQRHQPAESTGSTHIRLVEPICRNRQTDKFEQGRHTRPITHVSSNPVGDVNVFEARDVLYGPQSSNGTKSSACRSKQVAQHPIVGGVCVHESSRHHATGVHPGRFRRGYGGTEEIDVLYDAERLLFCQFVQRIENDTRSQAEADERDRPNARMSLYQNVRQNETCSICPVQCVRPRIINEIT